MQLSFKKISDEEITVEFKKDDLYQMFSYPEMVLKIYEERTCEEPEIIGSFTEKEKESIAELIKELRLAISEAEHLDEET